MRKNLLFTLLLGATAFTAMAQPSSSSFPVRKACREVMPHILYILGADQVTATNQTYIFQKHLGGFDTIRINSDSMPASLVASSRQWSLKFRFKEERIYIRNENTPTWMPLNENGYLFKEFNKDHLRETTTDRFLLEAVACCFLYQTGITDARQGEREPGSLNGIAYNYLPTMGIENMKLAEQMSKTFCPPENNNFTGEGAEIVPFGGINICYRKSRR